MKRTFAAIGAAVLTLAAADATLAQAPRPGNAARPEDKTLHTQDGWSIPITYFPAAGGKESAVIVMLPGKGGNRQVWRRSAEQLNAAGYAVVTVDLRKHGESTPPGEGGRSDKFTTADYQAMAFLDLGAVKAFLLQEHADEKLNIRKTGLVAADDSAPVAMTWAQADWFSKPYSDAPTMDARTPRGQDVRAIALLSPTDSVGRLVLSRNVAALRNDAFGIAFWIAVGSEDRADKGTAEKAYDLLTPGANKQSDRVFIDEFDQVKARGTELLSVGSASIDRRLLTFFDKFLKPLDGPNDRWRNRKSRLE